jgi:hypothetical protein
MRPAVSAGGQEGNRVQRAGHKASFVASARSVRCGRAAPAPERGCGVEFQPRDHLAARISKSVRCSWLNRFGSRARGILAGIADQEGFTLFQHPLAGGGRARLLSPLESEARLKPQVVEVHPAYVGIVRDAQNGGKFGQFVQCRVRIAIEEVKFRVGSECLKIAELLTLHRTHTTPRTRRQRRRQASTFAQLSVSCSQAELTVTQRGDLRGLGSYNLGYP